MATRTGEETAELRAVADARAALDRAEAAVVAKREALIDRMADAARAGELISRIALKAKYEREHVRRLVRRRGVEPKQPDREPPPPRRRKTDPAEDEARTP